MKYIAIRQEKNGSLYMDKDFFDKFKDKDLVDYGYQKIELADDEFENIAKTDFVINEETGEICFSEEKQAQRLKKERELAELPILQKELESLSQDIIQMLCGAEFPDKSERLERFRVAHNRYREIIGKEPRIYNMGEV